MDHLKKDYILVLVPSYSEFFLDRTIEDAYEKAKYPDRLFFGIFNQRTSPKQFDSFDKYKNVKCVNVFYEKPLGAGAARLGASLLHEGEEYICQIDAHTFFAQNWDEYYLNSYKELNQYIDKPIISNTFSGYSVKEYENYEYQKKFNGDIAYPLTLNFRGDTVADYSRVDEARFLGKYQEHGLMYRRRWSI